MAKIKLTPEKLWKLRTEVVLCSLFTSDYRNSMGIEEHKCQNFFDGYADYLQDLMTEDGLDDCGDRYFDYFKQYDCKENLWNYLSEMTAGRYISDEDGNLFSEANYRL